MFILASPAGTAGDDCDPASNDPTRTLVQTLTQIPRMPTRLPAGQLTRDQLRDAFESLADRGESVLGLFRALNDGVPRTADGADLQALFDEYKVDLDFMPIANLKELVSDGHKVDFVFDFGGDETKDVVMRGKTNFLLTSGIDDTSVENATIREFTGEDYAFRSKERISFYVNENGIERLGDGDLQLKKVVWFDVQLASRFIPNELYKEGNDAILAKGPDGRPLVRDGHYVLQRFSEWNSVQVLGTERALRRLPPIVSQRLRR